MAAGEAVREAVFILWLRHFHQGECAPFPIHTDSQSALAYVRESALEDMRKHVDVVLNHARERDRAELVHFEYVPGTSNTDRLTEAMPRPTFERHKANLHLAFS